MWDPQLHSFANGWDTSPVQRSDHIPNIKSVGNSATTPRDLTTEKDVKLMLYLLAESVCARMRELASRCTVVELYVRDTELCSIVRQRKLPAPSCSSQELTEVGMSLFRRHYRRAGGGGGHGPDVTLCGRSETGCVGADRRGRGSIASAIRLYEHPAGYCGQ